MITSFSSFIPDGLSAYKKPRNLVTHSEAGMQQPKGSRAGTVMRALASQFNVSYVAQGKNPDPAVLSLLVLVLALKLSLQIVKFGAS